MLANVFKKEHITFIDVLRIQNMDEPEIVKPMKEEKEPEEIHDLAQSSHKELHKIEVSTDGATSGNAGNDKRDLGISGFEGAPWGTHVCHFYHTKVDLLDILLPYFKVGLESNEFCMWVTSEPLGIKDAKDALRKTVPDLDNYQEKGQIEILDYGQWYIKSGRFEADKVLQGWIDKEKKALNRGFDGLRLAGNTFWLEKKVWNDFTNYEEKINSVLGNHKMLAICSYNLDKCGVAELLDVVSNHQFALIRRNGKWKTIENCEEKIEKSLKEKEILLKEIHHRVKNNLQIISSILNLQIANIKEKEVVEIIRGCQGRIKTMALVHENTYQSENLGEINLVEYIRSLTDSLLKIHIGKSKNFALEITDGNIFLNIDKVIPCALIINEIVSNSIKHAFPHGNGKICIDVKLDENKIILTLSDSGVGLPKDFDFRKSSSLGFQLVCTLVDQLNGTIELDKRKGTKFNIGFAI